MFDNCHFCPKGHCGSMWTRVHWIHVYYNFRTYYFIVNNELFGYINICICSICICIQSALVPLHFLLSCQSSTPCLFLHQYLTGAQNIPFFFLYFFFHQNCSLHILHLFPLLSSSFSFHSLQFRTSSYYLCSALIHSCYIHILLPVNTDPLSPTPCVAYLLSIFTFIPLIHWA